MKASSLGDALTRPRRVIEPATLRVAPLPNDNAPHKMAAWFLVVDTALTGFVLLTELVRRESGP